MIRIYTDQPECLALTVRDAAVEIHALPAMTLHQPSVRLALEHRRIGWATAALLVLVAGGAGYIVAPRPHVSRQADAAELRYEPLPAVPMLSAPPPAAAPESAAALEQELASPPTVEPPPAAVHTPAAGPAAFGLQQ
jgi:hypothetical protein